MPKRKIYTKPILLRFDPAVVERINAKLETAKLSEFSSFADMARKLILIGLDTLDKDKQ